MWRRGWKGDLEDRLGKNGRFSTLRLWGKSHCRSRIAISIDAHIVGIIWLHVVSLSMLVHWGFKDHPPCCIVLHPILDPSTYVPYETLILWSWKK